MPDPNAYVCADWAGRLGNSQDFCNFILRKSLANVDSVSLLFVSLSSDSSLGGLWLSSAAHIHSSGAVHLQSQTKKWYLFELALNYNKAGVLSQHVVVPICHQHSNPILFEQYLSLTHLYFFNIYFWAMYV